MKTFISTLISTLFSALLVLTVGPSLSPKQVEFNDGIPSAFKAVEDRLDLQSKRITTLSSVVNQLVSERDKDQNKIDKLASELKMAQTRLTSLEGIYQTPEVSNSETPQTWITYADALAGNKPVLIHFRADWCLPCKKLESDVFPREEVIKELSKFSCVILDVDSQFGTTTVKEAFSNLVKGNYTLPRELLIDPKTRMPLWSGTVPVTAEAYLNHLRSL